MQSKKLPTIISKVALNKWLLMNELSVGGRKVRFDIFSFSVNFVKLQK